jgi:ABC-type antimicrobial peptide transport system permease subunit
VYDVETFEEKFQDILARPRFHTTAALFLGGFALLLAVLATYGAALNSVAQRRHEIAIRIAVGASPFDMRRMLLQQGMLPVAVGAVAGVVGAIALRQMVHHLIYSSEPSGVLTCAIASSVLACTSGFAIWISTSRVKTVEASTMLNLR